MQLISPTYWKTYELIDSGNFRKLERFGSVVALRPEPQAVWEPTMKETEWNRIATVEYIPTSANAGKWKKNKPVDDSWTLEYCIENDHKKKIFFRLALTSFKHVGIFPEQAANWEFIYSQCQLMQQPQVLNLFAYTGAASVVAAKAGAIVTHVDSVKQIVNWASKNASLNEISNIRWIIDDAMKFVKREIRRNRKYHGIILDPPAFGHGPNGEDWKLERDITEMMKLLSELAHPQHFFLVLNVYSLGLSALVLENIAKTIFNGYHYDYGELFVADNFGKKLPLGAFVHIKK
ncbi:MAG: class I SAM-dependent methyltransferase [Bacteroidales bacterium]|nr:class I SAM-dependent methyltransferase [Bacteroidales bacterium]